MPKKKQHTVEKVHNSVTKKRLQGLKNDQKKRGIEALDIVKQEMYEGYLQRELLSLKEEASSEKEVHDADFDEIFSLMLEKTLPFVEGAESKIEKKSKEEDLVAEGDSLGEEMLRQMEALCVASLQQGDILAIDGQGESFFLVVGYVPSPSVEMSSSLYRLWKISPHFSYACEDDLLFCPCLPRGRQEEPASASEAFLQRSAEKEKPLLDEDTLWVVELWNGVELSGEVLQACASLFGRLPLQIVEVFANVAEEAILSSLYRLYPQPFESVALSPFCGGRLLLRPESEQALCLAFREQERGRLLGLERWLSSSW